MLKITTLKTDNLSECCITDNPHPEFSFVTESDRAHNRLKRAVLNINGWSCETTRQTGIVYDGPALKPMQEYRLELLVEDRFSETAQTSMCFETGMLGTVWQGKWITDGAYVFRQRRVSPRPMQFRRRLALKKPVKRARIFATAIGIYELRLNGQKVGRDYFAPGFTSYRHELQYQVYDITSMLHADSVLDAVVAGGWAVGSYTYFRRNRVYGRKQAFLCQIHLEYADGTYEMIGSDEQFQVSMNGRFKEADLYDGEVYDATVQEDLLDWHPASVTEPQIKPKLMAEYGFPVRKHERFTPVSVTRAPSGELIYDMGQNFAGVIHAKIRGQQGQKVRFRHAEILRKGELYTEPLRSAKQRAEYTCVQGEQ